MSSAAASGPRAGASDQLDVGQDGCSQRPAGAGYSGSHVDAHTQGLSSVPLWSGCLGWGLSSEGVPLQPARVALVLLSQAAGATVCLYPGWWVRGGG